MRRRINHRILLSYKTFSRNQCVRVTPIIASTLSTSAYTKFWLITTGTVILYYGAAESH